MNILDQRDISSLTRLIGDASNVTIIVHIHPDGDAVGSGIAMLAYLSSIGKDAVLVLPDSCPASLTFLTERYRDKVMVYEENPGQVSDKIMSGDLIICQDFNSFARAGDAGEKVAACRAGKILIDHHLHPPVDGYALQFSDTYSCSTSYIVYQLIVALAGEEAIDQAMAEALYVGIMTDTGNFSFSYLTSDLFRAAAVLIDRGVNVPHVNSSVYDNFSEGRMRLLGYMLNDKMVTDYRYGVAYVSLTEEDMRRFNFIQGDSEGFVNYPLSIRGIRMSAMFIQTKHSIRVSLRSRGDVDVNVFARRYFEGGGHRNAAGGRSYVSMDETLKKFQEDLKEYFGA